MTFTFLSRREESPTVNRPQRLIGVLVALQAHRHMTAAQLSEQFEVSTRTILRDIDALIDADVPVIAERGRYGGISLIPGADLDVNRLTGTESDVLSLVGVDLKRARQLGLEAATRSAAQKLSSRRRLPLPRHSAPALPLSEVVAIDASGWFASDDTHDFADLVAELRAGRRLLIDYRSSGEQAVREYVVDPHGLFSRGGRWYLIADVDGAPRMFATTRLVRWQSLNEQRRIRSDANLAEAADSLVRTLEGRDDVIIVALLDAGSMDLAKRILGSRLLGAETSDDPDRVRIEVGYSEIGGVRQLLQFADHIEILAPAQARKLAGELAAQMATKHQSKPQGGLSVSEG
ncbi:helix-turn-helix transcriptional regulator [Brevibacterium antiquum]|uniref:helix-turn-helix transcriptional regulator n=1 Tax=Brevibacterium antiquum TaxID=234835 RepID=UPI0022B75B8E|nr:WYL domain-containing protein [Brevibacterium antiquum]